MASSTTPDVTDASKTPMTFSQKLFKPKNLAFVIALIAAIAMFVVWYKGLGGTTGTIATGATTAPVFIASLLYALYETFKKQKMDDIRYPIDDLGTGRQTSLSDSTRPMLNPSSGGSGSASDDLGPPSDSGSGGPESSSGSSDDSTPAGHERVPHSPAADALAAAGKAIADRASASPSASSAPRSPPIPARPNASPGMPRPPTSPPPGSSGRESAPSPAVPSISAEALEKIWVEYNKPDSKRLIVTMSQTDLTAIVIGLAPKFLSATPAYNTALSKIVKDIKDNANWNAVSASLKSRYSELIKKINFPGS